MSGTEPTTSVDAEDAGDVVWICHHTSAFRDRPPEVLPWFTHMTSDGRAARGNARADLREIAEAEIEKWRTRSRENAPDITDHDPLPGEPFSEAIGRLETEMGRWLEQFEMMLTRESAAVEQVNKAVNMTNHHQLRCPTCRYTARIGAVDLETLGAWALRHGYTELPLTLHRQLLDRIAAENLGRRAT